MTAILKIRNNYRFQLIIDKVPGLDPQTVIFNGTDCLYTDSITQVEWDLALTKYKNENLDDHKKRSIKGIDVIAERVRETHITPGEGQAMAYLRKEDDAQRYRDDGYPNDITLYKWLQAEIAATGTVARVVADRILEARDSWVQVGSDIETIRRRGKEQITMATTVEMVDQVYNGCMEALAAITNE